MSGQPNASVRGIILGLAALIIIWGLFGLAERKNVPYGGYQSGPDDEVLRVDGGGPADQAGMLVGDRIISRNGISVDDRRTLRRQPRAKIGETRPFVVERTDSVTGDTTTETLAVTFSAYPTSRQTAWSAFDAIGLGFLLCGILAYFRVPSPVSLLFCVVGLCFGAAMFQGPYISAFGLRMFKNVIEALVDYAGFAALLHFLLVFPKRKKILEKAGRARLVYLPAVLLALMGIFNLILEPESGGPLRYLAGILFLSYPVLSVVAMIHSFSKATPMERSTFGLNYVFWGVLIGLIPLTLLAVFGIFAPGISLPGAGYSPLTVVVIPVAFALAIMKAGRKPAVIL